MTTLFFISGIVNALLHVCVHAIGSIHEHHRLHCMFRLFFRVFIGDASAAVGLHALASAVSLGLFMQ